MRPHRHLALLTAVAVAPAALATGEVPAEGANGMVASAHPAATEAAVSILRAGGNAVDAAVTAAFVLAVVEPHSSGVGGGGFLLLHQELEQQTRVLDFREQAPAAASRDMYLRAGTYLPELSREGWLSVATPGAAAGYLEALERWGTLPRRRVLAPAIRLAREGFIVTEELALATERSLEKLRRDPEAARVFLLPTVDGQPPAALPVGHRLRQPDLANTLEALARSGRDGFYGGAVGAALVSASETGGGILTADDLATYRPVERQPIVGRYRGLEVHSMPPPSSGGTVLVQVLNILARFDLSRDGWHSARGTHLLVEALRRAYADRNTQLGDPAFVKNPVERLTDPAYAAVQRRRIDPLRATPSSEVQPLTAPEADGGSQTSHISVVDAAGNAVAMTTTVNYLFGSGVVAPKTGVLLNNEMDDFAAAPGQPNIYGLVQHEANAVAPRKIPLSSMSPTLVFARDGDRRRLRMVLGAPGGPTIITTVLQTLLNVVLFRMNIAEAVAAPRIHHQWLPDRIRAEPGALRDDVKAELERLGHSVEEGGTWGDAQCILVDPETDMKYGASDPRGEGVAAGF